jgi:hypothetical protein
MLMRACLPIPILSHLLLTLRGSPSNSATKELDPRLLDNSVFDNSLLRTVAG